MVGMTRFEHATPWSQTRCSTKLSYIPSCDGAGDRSRTHDLLITSQLLYQLSYTGIKSLRHKMYYAINIKDNATVFLEI